MGTAEKLGFGFGVGARSEEVEHDGLTGDGSDGERWSGVPAVEPRRPYCTSLSPALGLSLHSGVDVGRCNAGKGWEIKS